MQLLIVEFLITFINPLIGGLVLLGCLLFRRPWPVRLAAAVTATACTGLDAFAFDLAELPVIYAGTLAATLFQAECCLFLALPAWDLGKRGLASAWRILAVTLGHR